MNAESKITIAVSLFALAFGATSLGFSVYSWNVMNNYPPSVEIRDTSALLVNENCSPVHQTTKDCTLSGDFSLSLGITSPHAGKYNVSIVSFSPTSAFMYSLNNVSFLGKNLTLIDFVVGNGGYQIKVKNETSGHFIYYEYIGGQPPG